MSEAIVERGSQSAPAPVASPRELLPYAVFAGLLLLVILYFTGAEQGATSLIGGSSVHEWVHDAHHLLGFPCH
jgi:hypothetical protein